MTIKEATRNYYRVFIPMMLIFLGGSLAITWLDVSTETPNILLAALAVIPIGAILSMFWLHWRFMQEIDEFLREVQTRGIMIGAATALGAGTAWGYLEMYVDAPAISVFWLNPLFWIAYSIATAILLKRTGGDLI